MTSMDSNTVLSFGLLQFDMARTNKNPPDAYLYQIETGRYFKVIDYHFPKYP